MTHVHDELSEVNATSAPQSSSPHAVPASKSMISIQDEVEIGIDSLLRAREQDPYLDPATRLLYERVKGEAAPTFPPAVLDAAVERTRLAMKGKRRRQKRMQSGGASVGAAGIAADGPASGATAAADKLADEVAATVKE